MVAAVRVHKVGGPEVLTYEDVPVAEPGPGQVKVRNPCFESIRERGCA
jgi:NADPH2:quinone reductase